MQIFTPFYNFSLLFIEKTWQDYASFVLELALLITLFEIVPIFFNVKSSLRKNFSDFFHFQFFFGLWATTLLIILYIIFYSLPIQKGYLDITHMSNFTQSVILLIIAEFFIYIFHRSAHLFKIPILSKAHRFHHTITTDIDWVNSRKEHIFIISLFVTVFAVLFFVVFKSSPLSHGITLASFLLLLSFSHFKLPLSLPYLDKFFLFPKDHLRHHTKYHGPYGISLSIFDTLFNTRNDK